MKKTIYFEAVKGFLIRLYANEIDPNSKVKYHGVCTVEIDGKTAVIKGAAGNITHRNIDDIFEELRRLGVNIVTWERYDDNGNIKKSITKRL